MHYIVNAVQNREMDDKTPTFDTILTSLDLAKVIPSTALILLHPDFVDVSIIISPDRVIVLLTSINASKPHQLIKCILNN